MNGDMFWFPLQLVLWDGDLTVVDSTFSILFIVNLAFFENVKTVTCLLVSLLAS